MPDPALARAARRRAGPERSEPAGLGDEQLDAVAADAGVLVPGRHEAHGSEADAGEPLAREVLGEARAVEPRRAEQLERPRGAARLGQVRPLEEAHARVDERGLRGRHVRRRKHPGQPGLAERRPAPPALAGDDLELELEPPLGAEEERELAHRHAVSRGEIVEAAEALEPGREPRPLDRAPPMGFGRSSTTNGTRASAAASMQSIIVAWYV